MNTEAPAVEEPGFRSFSWGANMEDNGTIDADGFQLRYTIAGKGTNAIVIGSSVFYPRTFSQNLREQLRMVFLDHRGFARLPRTIPERSFDLHTIVDDIERARRRLKLDRVVIIGHSGHAYMALEYAKTFPHRVSHLVMIGAAPDLSPASAAAAERSWQESVSPERKAALEENVQRTPDDSLASLSPAARFVKTYVRKGPKLWFNPAYDCAPLWDGVEPNEVLFRIWGDVFSQIDVTHRLESLQTPVFLALGRYDFEVAPPSSWDPFRKHFQNLTVRVFEKSGHTPQLEEPQAFDSELLAWMGNHRARR